MENDLIYQKYEQYSSQYVISWSQIRSLMSRVDNQTTLDQLIVKECYYNLPNSFTSDLELKLKHNIKLCIKNLDDQFLLYLQKKFKINDDFKKISIDDWHYNPNKLKIKLKVKTLIKGYQLHNDLASFLEIDQDCQFKYKSQIVRLVHKHIYENHLQDQTNPHQIIPDKYLFKLLNKDLMKEKFCTIYNLPELLDHLIIAS